jgi:hypothetical protein
MTHQICTRIALNEERFYVNGALVIASSLRNTEIQQILSVWSLEAFLRLLGRFREMTRACQNTLFNTKMQRHRHRGSPLDYMIFFQDSECIIYREFRQTFQHTIEGENSATRLPRENSVSFQQHISRQSAGIVW